ncbi:MAG TPA: CcdB family protein [Crenalkalicoccus sp.]|nr:CcdB family protein [Crenalkalicoccus sp.]
MEECRRLEVWRLRDGRRLVLVVQSDLLLHLETRVVVPLLPPGSFRPVEDINPIVEVAGGTRVLAVQALSAIRRSELKVRVASLDTDEETRIVLKALDRLLTTS